jgi:hypothetical protein
LKALSFIDTGHPVAASKAMLIRSFSNEGTAPFWHDENNTIETGMASHNLGMPLKLIASQK